MWPSPTVHTIVLELPSRPTVGTACERHDVSEGRRGFEGDVLSLVAGLVVLERLHLGYGIRSDQLDLVDLIRKFCPLCKDLLLRECNRIRHERTRRGGTARTSMWAISDKSAVSGLFATIASSFSTDRDRVSMFFLLSDSVFLSVSSSSRILPTSSSWVRNSRQSRLRLRWQGLTELSSSRCFLSIDLTSLVRSSRILLTRLPYSLTTAVRALRRDVAVSI